VDEEADVVLVAEAMAVVEVLEEAEVLEAVEEVGGIEVPVEGEVGGVLEPEPANPWPWKGPVTEPCGVRFPARVGSSATTKGFPTLIRFPALLAAMLVRGGAPLVRWLAEGGGPSDRAHASAGVRHDPGAAQAFAEKLRPCTANWPPPVECSAKMAWKHFCLRQSAAPRDVVRTAARRTDTEAEPSGPMVTTVVLRLSQPSCSDEEGSGSNRTAFGSHSAMA
jgi:hypothetical protein